MQNEISINLIPDIDIFSIVPLLRILNPAIPEGILRDRLSEMVSQGYRCAGAYSGDRLVGICGMWILIKYYVGRHLEPDNVVVLEDCRSMGVGRRLLAFVHEYARSQGCIASELNCYLKNGKAQKFWEREGYRKIAFHYQKVLPPE
jgi:GNAT superfamily N-acetyltransferase